MRRLSIFLLWMTVVLGTAGFVVACSDDGSSGTARLEGQPSGEDASDGVNDEDAGTITRDSGPGPSDDASEGDAGTDAPPGCPPVAPGPPNLDGPNTCKALDFARPAAPFVKVQNDAGLSGGTIPPGIYDVKMAERASGNAGSWRETIVIGDNGRFSRTRQIDASGNGVGPLTYRSGTFTTSGNELTLTEDCTSVDGNPGTNTMQYDVTTDACGQPTFQYSVTGFRFTFERR